MILHEVFGILAGVVSFLAYFFYIVTIPFGKTRPSRSTWWVLTLIGFMIAFSYWSLGARDTIWIALSYTLGPLIIALLSLKYGEGKWQKLDTICFSVSLASALVWYISNSAIIALLINIFMDFVGLLPTIQKSYLRPSGEDRPAWTLESIASILNILAIENWVFSIAFYPIYLALINGIITLFLYKPIFKTTQEK